MHPTSRQNFGDAPGQTPKLILTLCPRWKDDVLVWGGGANIYPSHHIIRIISIPYQTRTSRHNLQLKTSYICLPFFSAESLPVELSRWEIKSLSLTLKIAEMKYPSHSHLYCGDDLHTTMKWIHFTKYIVWGSAQTRIQTDYEVGSCMQSYFCKTRKIMWQFEQLIVWHPLLLLWYMDVSKDLHFWRRPKSTFSWIPCNVPSWDVLNTLSSVHGKDVSHTE